MNRVYILIGGNLGDRESNLEKARTLIKSSLGEIIKISSIYETASWGINDQPHFLNQVLLLTTTFSPEKIMKEILFIEKNIGRIRSQKNASRIIDIDILFFNDEIIDQENLVIPHPEIQNRKFVLIPLLEIEPDLIHPVFNQTIKKLLSTSKDQLDVKRMSKS